MTRPFALLCGLIVAIAVSAADPAGPPKGQQVFSSGHSFHMFMPAILADIAKSAHIHDHKQVGVSSIGGSRVIQHWNKAEDKNTAKAALKSGKVDVFTMSPIYLPDEGIGNFTKLALEHNPDVRVLIQEFWLPFDVYQPDYQKKRPEKADRNSRTVAEMKRIHAPYFKSMDDHAAALNKEHGKPVVSIVPVGQAVILLREKIIESKAPGLKVQEDLFRDAIGHVQPPVMALTAYCHFAVIYKRSPVGLPVPAILKNAKNPEWGEDLNKLLQELAWKAVTEHPLSGVTAAGNR
jgi:hypothetical protein